MHVGSLAPSTSHPPFLFAGEALHPPLLCALTFAPHLFFAGLALHPPSALRPQLCTPPLFCGLSFAGIKGFPKLKSLNAYFLAKIGADTAENEQHFAEILPKIGNYPTGPPATPEPRGFGARPELVLVRQPRRDALPPRVAEWVDPQIFVYARKLDFCRTTDLRKVPLYPFKAGSGIELSLISG